MAWNSSDRLERLPANWSTVIQPRILKRDNYRCQIDGPDCQKIATEVDHIERGDNHDPSNLQAVCERCHSRKSAREGNAAKAKLRALRLRPAERHPGSRY